MAVVAHDPADQLASLQSALTARARALCGDQGPAPDAVVGAAASPLVHVHRLPARPGRTGTL